MVQYLHHISLGVRDLEKSIDFYQTFLGFRLIPRPDLGFPGVWMKLAQTQLHLLKRDGEYLKKAPPRAIHYAFQVTAMDELDTKEQWLKARQIPYRRMVQKGSGVQQIFFTDLNQINIELGYYPE